MFMSDSVPNEKVIAVINKLILLGAKETSPLPPPLLSFFLKFSIQDISSPRAYQLCEKYLAESLLKREIPSVWNILKFHSTVFVLNFSLPLPKRIFTQFKYNLHFIILFGFFDSEI